MLCKLMGQSSISLELALNFYPFIPTTFILERKCYIRDALCKIEPTELVLFVKTCMTSTYVENTNLTVP